MKSSLPIFFFFFFSLVASSQTEHEYVGVITLNDSSFISYKLIFTENNGAINGYSVTDLSGPHETKSVISGKFDAKGKRLEFSESGIVYTKSDITQEDFCYIHFNGRVAKLNQRKKLSGAFVGKYGDNQICINGKIDMRSLIKAEKRAVKMDRKVKKSILIPKEQKAQVSLVKSLDTLNTNFIRAKEKVQVFTRDNTVVLTVFDVGQNDGDRISILVDDKPLLTNALVSSEPQEFVLSISNKAIEIKIEATSSGKIGANTVQINLTDSLHSIESITNMNAGESAVFKIVKQ